MKDKVVRLYDIYHNADEYAEHIHQANLEHHILEAGNFYGELTEIISEKVMVSTHKMNQTLLQIGKGLKNYTTFLLPGNMNQDLTWRNQRLTGRRIGLLKSEMIHFGVTPTNFFATAISLRNDFFNELIIKLGFDTNLFQAIQQREVIEIEQEDAFRIQQIVIELCNSEDIDLDILENKLPVIVLNALDNVCDDLQKKISSSRDILFGKSLSYIHENLNRKLNTRDVCLAIETSERSLRYIFQEMTGLTPMKYIKAIKLNKARKEIIQLNGETNISLIANKWGFGHSGQFASDYKKLFGEYPSQTLSI